MDASYAEIVTLLQAYFDGFYASDVDKLKRVFHPDCHLISATGGPLVDDPMDVVYARVAGRTPPAAENQKESQPRHEGTNRNFARKARKQKVLRVFVSSW